MRVTIQCRWFFRKEIRPLPSPGSGSSAYLLKPPAIALIVGWQSVCRPFPARASKEGGQDLNLAQTTGDKFIRFFFSLLSPYISHVVSFA